ncbi:hypothetical protein BGZ46_008695 [Entomortierella lignicola]|nr:hypothetical protein BGZ46_008695 [Entomortierella lignicola]
MTAPTKPSSPASAGASSSSAPATSSPQHGIWSGSRPVAENTPAVNLEAQSNRLIMSSTIPTVRLTYAPTTTAVTESVVSPNSSDISTLTPSTTRSDSTTFKIRIPRDLPNIPAAFRKRGAIRSQPSVSQSARYSPLPSTTSRPRSTESEPLYQTKLVVSPRESIDNGKRTHNDMLTEDPQAPKNYLMLEPRVGLEKKMKAIKPEIAASDHPMTNPNNSTQADLNKTGVSEQESKTSSMLELITQIPIVTQPSTSTLTITDNIKKEEPADVSIPSISRLKRKRSRTKSEPDSPIVAPVRFPTPTSIGGGTIGDVEEASHDFESAPMDSVVISPIAPIESSNISAMLVDSDNIPVSEISSSSKSSQSLLEPPPNMSEANIIKSEKIDNSTKDQVPPRGNSIPPSAHSTVNSTPDPNEPSLSPIELVRLGTTVLNRLLSNPICRNFINKVPETVMNYHAVIKRPMDLTTIEHKLWRGLVLYQSTSNTPIAPGALLAASGYKMSAEGYSNFQEFEKDLQRIYRNAIYFNPPQQIIYKEAQSFEALYNDLLRALREHRLTPMHYVPQEHYSPSLISLSEPGPIYLFRAHQVREMDRKMTDISVDLFATLHQPLLEVMYATEDLSPEKPQFARLYINKNRSLLDTCRDDPQAKVIIFSDYHVRKASTDAPRPLPGVAKPGGSIKMVGIKARAMIVKPIGERYEMVTVGDLDCPSAWIMVACVKSFDWEVDIPAKFEKGILSKMRHEVVPFGVNSKLSPEHLQAFSDSVGLQLEGVMPQVAIKSEPSQSEYKLEPVNDSGPTTSKATAEHDITSVSSTLPKSDSTNPQEGENMILLEPKVENQDITLFERSIPNASAESTPASALVTLDTTKTSKPFLPPISSSLPSSNPDMPAKSKQETNHDSSQLAVHSADRSLPESKLDPMKIDSNSISLSSGSDSNARSLTEREQQMLRDLKAASREKNVPYISWNSIEPTLTVDSAHGLFKRIYHVQGNDGLVVQNFKEMDSESFEQRVREVVCLLKLRGSEGIGQIQAIIDNEMDHLVGLSMTKYAYTLKAYATSARRHPSPRQKLSLVRDMVTAICAIHSAGLAHRDLSEVNIMVDEDSNLRLEDNTPRPWVRVIDFGKSVFVEPEEVKRWSVLEPVSEDFDHSPLPPVDPRLEDVYSLGVLIWRTFSGKSPWNGAIEDDLKAIRYLVRTDAQIKFHLEREVTGRRSRELLLKCLTADPETRSTSHQLKEWLEQPEILADLLSEFEALGGGRKRVRKILD